jgi:electron transfer flavoprotein beta subunit
LKILVCVKQVPDSAATVIVDNGTVTWGNADLVLNPWDEYAVEAALLSKEAHGGSVTVMTIAQEGANEALKQALAMGSEEAILVSDPELTNMDSQATAKVLAAAIQKIGDVDLVFFGRQAIDGDIGLTHTQTARVLGWPSLTLVSAISALDPDGKTIEVERAVEEGRQIVTSQLPAVVSVIKDFAEPRYPSFMGIRKAARAVIPTWSLSDLGISAPEKKTFWPEVSNPPKKEVVCEIITGSGPQEIAENLVEKIMAEKVL